MMLEQAALFIASGVASEVLGELVSRGCTWAEQKLLGAPLSRALQTALRRFLGSLLSLDDESVKELGRFFKEPEVKAELASYMERQGYQIDVERLHEVFQAKGYAERLRFRPGFHFGWEMDRFEDMLATENSRQPEIAAVMTNKLLADPSLDYPRVERRYLSAVERENRFVDARGIAQFRNIVWMELDEIYTELSLAQEMPEADDISDPALREERDKEGAKGPEAPARRRLRRRERVAWRAETSLKEVLREQRPTAILGDPGSGKSTLLRHLALTLARGEGERYGLPEGMLPVLLPLRYYAARLAEGCPQTLLYYIPHYFEGQYIALPGRFLEHALREGRCLVMLDGLDEVVHANLRITVADEVQNLIRAFPENRFVITCRVAAYRTHPLPGDNLICTIKPFGPEQMRLFTERWCLAMARRDAERQMPEEAARDEGRRLYEAIVRSERVRAVASNPLLCTIVGLIHHTGGALPTRRVELYETFLKTIVASWEAQKRIAGDGPMLDERQTYRVLEEVALRLHEATQDNLIHEEELIGVVAELLVRQWSEPRGPAESKAHSLIKLIRERTGLLIERDVQRFGFMHLAFQEYLAARALARRRAERAKALQEHMHSPRWREVILLTAARLGEVSEEDATEFVQTILERPDPYETHLHRALLLAGACLGDDVPVEPPLARRILDELKRLFVETRIGALRRDVGSVLAGMRRTTYEKEAESFLLSSLSYEATEVKEAAATALGELGRRSESVIHRLEQLLEDGDDGVRAAAIRALATLDPAHPTLSETVLRELSSGWPWYVTGVLDEVEDPSGRIGAALTERLISKDSLDRLHAANGLGMLRKGSPEVLEALRGRLRVDNDAWVIEAAAEALVKLGEAESSVAEILRGRLADADRGARLGAAAALAALGDAMPEVVRTLLDGLRDHKVSNQFLASQALQHVVPTPEVANDVMNLFQSEDYDQRGAAAEALGKLGHASPEVVGALLTLLRSDPEWYPRVAAARALAWLGQPTQEVVMGLVRGLGSPDWRVRLAAVVALEGLNHRAPEVVISLVQHVSEASPEVRHAAARALGSLGVGGELVLDSLVKRLGDEDGGVRDAAYTALVRLNPS